MKRHILTLIFALIASMTTVSAQSSLSAPRPKAPTTNSPRQSKSKKSSSRKAAPSAKKQTAPKSSSQPERKVLYTLGSGEQLSIGEVNFSLKAGKRNCVLITKNQNDETYSLIFNGSSKVSGAKWIEASVLDPDNFANCCFRYKTKTDKWYVVSQGATYGPFDDVYVGWGPACSTYEVYTDDKSVRYYGSQVVDTPFEKYFEKSKFEPVKLKSVNGRHTLIATDFNSYIFDGTKYSPLANTSNYESVYMMVYPNGEAVLRFYDKSSSSNVFYSLKDGKSVKMPSNKELNFLTGQFSSQLGEGNVTMDWSVYCNPQWENAYNYVRKISDATGQHVMETSGMYDFVMIDNKSYGKSCALNLWFDPEDNAFRWTALEGREVVYYSYSL